MKLFFLLLLITVQLYSCSSQPKTDNKSIEKVVTTREYLLLNQDYNKLDSLHQQKSVKKFDKENNVLEDMDFYRSDLTFSGGIIYKYDDSSQLNEEFLLDIHNKVIASYHYEFLQNKSNKFEIIKNSKIKRETSYYDTNKNVVRQVTFYDDGKIMSDFYFKFSSENKEIERRGLLENKRTQTNYKSYNNLSQLVEQISKETNGIVISLEKFIYEGSDENGNWKTRKSILNSVPHSITFQIIEYYKSK